MIIDAHTHLDDVNLTGFSKEKRLEQLLKTMKKNKIDHALVLADIPSHPEEKMLSNEELLRLIEPHKQLHLVGKVPLSACQNAAFLTQVRKHVEKGNMVGIKLYPGYELFYPNDQRYNNVYNICQEFDIPVMFHSGDVMYGGSLKHAQPLYIDEVASSRPKLKIIVCHMGNPWILDTAALTSKNENVYADMAGLFYKRLDPGMKMFLERKIEEFVHWNAHGEKLIFGTDWPITDVGDTIKIIKDDKSLSSKDKKLIFGENTKKLFKIK